MTLEAAPLLRSWVRIPPGEWIFVCCECRVLSGRGLCDELITRLEESYRLCCVVVCESEYTRSVWRIDASSHTILALRHYRSNPKLDTDCAATSRLAVRSGIVLITSNNPLVCHKR